MKNKNIPLLIGNILSSIYSFVLLYYLIQLGDTSSVTIQQGLPLFMIVFVIYTIGTVFGWIGFAKATHSFVLVSTILYFSGLVTVLGTVPAASLLSALAFIPIFSIVLGFIAYSKQKKIK